MSNQVAVASEVRSESQLGVKLMLITFRVSVVLTLFIAGAIGIFGIACLIGGALTAGGPLELAQGWFSAVSGL
ncbi:MAG: hypothetical protein RQ754_14720 [Desulfuromonadales bacterium]|jgi:hypothetical protein|nr:hypothetical protein [Desulfuromonadales bacterium]